MTEFCGHLLLTRDSDMIFYTVMFCVPCSFFDTILDILANKTGSGRALKTPTTATVENKKKNALLIGYDHSK